MNKEHRAPVLSQAQFKKVLAALHGKSHCKRNTALLYFSYALGLRAKEMSMLKVQDVISTNGAIKEEVLLTRMTTKGRKQRLVYLTNPALIRSLQNYLDERRIAEVIPLHPEAPLFKSRKGSSFSPNTMQMLFKRIYKDAGLVSASSHSGRRTFATSLIEDGVDIKAVSNLMGHASVAMTARYVEDNPARLRKICKAVTLGVSPA